MTHRGCDALELTATRGVLMSNWQVLNHNHANTHLPEIIGLQVSTHVVVLMCTRSARFPRACRANRVLTRHRCVIIGLPGTGWGPTETLAVLTRTLSAHGQHTSLAFAMQTVCSRVTAA